MYELDLLQIISSTPSRGPFRIARDRCHLNLRHDGPCGGGASPETACVLWDFMHHAERIVPYTGFLL
jgi:hypothetical protein